MARTYTPHPKGPTRCRPAPPASSSPPSSPSWWPRAPPWPPRARAATAARATTFPAGRGRGSPGHPGPVGPVPGSPGRAPTRELAGLSHATTLARTTVPPAGPRRRPGPPRLKLDPRWGAYRTGKWGSGGCPHPPPRRASPRPVPPRPVPLRRRRRQLLQRRPPRWPPWPEWPLALSCWRSWSRRGSGPERGSGGSDDRDPVAGRCRALWPQTAVVAGVPAAVSGEPVARVGADSGRDPARPGAAVAVEAGGRQRHWGAAAGRAAGRAGPARAGGAGGGGRGGRDRAGRGRGARRLPGHVPDRGHRRAGRGRPQRGGVRADARAGPAVPRPAPVGRPGHPAHRRRGPGRGLDGGLVHRARPRGADPGRDDRGRAGRRPHPRAGRPGRCPPLAIVVACAGGASAAPSGCRGTPTPPWPARPPRCCATSGWCRPSPARGRPAPASPAAAEAPSGPPWPPWTWRPAGRRLPTCCWPRAAPWSCGSG